MTVNPTTLDGEKSCYCAQSYWGFYNMTVHVNGESSMVNSPL